MSFDFTHKLTSALLKRGKTLVRLGALALAIAGGLRCSSSRSRAARMRNSDGNCDGGVLRIEFRLTLGGAGVSRTPEGPGTVDM